jgi:hypothetical protein
MFMAYSLCQPGTQCDLLKAINPYHNANFRGTVSLVPCFKITKEG